MGVAEKIGAIICVIKKRRRCRRLSIAKYLDIMLDEYWNKACRQIDTYMRVGVVAADSEVVVVQINWWSWNCQIAKVVELAVDLVAAAVDWYFQTRRRKLKSPAGWLLEYQISRVCWLCSL